MFVESDPRYGDPYEIDDDEVGAGQAPLVEDGDGMLVTHEVAPAELVEPVCFVDGVRTTDFRVHEVLETGNVVRGLAGSYGVGAVRCAPGERPRYLEPVIERLLFWTHGFHAVLPEVGGWVWAAEGLAVSDPNLLLNKLQERMRAREADLAGDLTADGATVVCDGPLNRFYGINAAVVGLVKSHNKAYLPADEHRRVPEVIARPGQRTSLFALRAEVWGCYLRLPTSGRVGPWAGIVRIDVPAAGGPGLAAAVADRAASVLPRYAGVAHCDPRAPANLQPIGALENRLRHLLGDPGGSLRAARRAAVLYDAAKVAGSAAGDGAPPSLPLSAGPTPSAAITKTEETA
jgi:hypothetical protein